MSEHAQQRLLRSDGTFRSCRELAASAVDCYQPTNRRKPRYRRCAARDELARPRGRRRGVTKTSLSRLEPTRVFLGRPQPSFSDPALAAKHLEEASTPELDLVQLCETLAPLPRRDWALGFLQHISLRDHTQPAARLDPVVTEYLRKTHEGLRLGHLIVPWDTPLATDAQGQTQLKTPGLAERVCFRHLEKTMLAIRAFHVPGFRVNLVTNSAALIAVGADPVSVWDYIESLGDLARQSSDKGLIKVIDNRTSTPYMSLIERIRDCEMTRMGFYDEVSNARKAKIYVDANNLARERVRWLQRQGDDTPTRKRTHRLRDDQVIRYPVFATLGLDSRFPNTLAISPYPGYSAGKVLPQEGEAVLDTGSGRSRMRVVAASVQSRRIDATPG